MVLLSYNSVLRPKIDHTVRRKFENDWLLAQRNRRLWRRRPNQRVTRKCRQLNVRLLGIQVRNFSACCGFARAIRYSTSSSQIGLLRLARLHEVHVSREASDRRFCPRLSTFPVLPRAKIRVIGPPALSSIAPGRRTDRRTRYRSKRALKISGPKRSRRVLRNWEAYGFKKMRS